MAADHATRQLVTNAKERAAEVLNRYYAAKQAHEKTARINWLGTLAITFTTDELQLICDNFSMDETLTLRSLGVLGPDQGFTTHKKARR